MTKNVTLYHGTLASLVPLIIERGLEPRGERPSHDAYMDSPSLPTFVYLTTNFGLAVEHACRISERTARKADIAVAQVDMSTLKKRLLYPDEDYLSHEWNSDFAGWTLDEQLEFMEGKRWTWKESLEMLGTVAYKGVVLASHITECPVLRWFEQEYRRRFQAVTCG